MAKFNLYLALLLLIGALACTSESKQEAAEEKPALPILAYYVPGEGNQPAELPLDQLTHIIFSFTKVIDGEMKFRNKEFPEILRALVAQKEKHPQLQVMIACGGWGADGFSDMAFTPESRQKFVNSAIAFIEEYQLDGIDIDWEYPGLPAADTKYRPNEDRENFTLLMKGLREKLDGLGRPQTLTFASAGWERYYDHIELDKVMQYADYMNVMTYDQVVGNTPYTGHHTPLGWIRMEDIKAYPFYEHFETREKESGITGPGSVKKIVDYCLGLGVRPEQIVIGGAFYGRAWQGVPPANNGLYQPNQGPYISWCPYSRIREEFEDKNGYQRYWDTIAEAPYLYNPTDSIFISYDDTASFRLKTEYAIDKGLGGIMFWQLSLDTKEENGLLDAIYEASR